NDLLTYYILTFFFFNDTATTEIYTLSLHDALPISESLDDNKVRAVFAYKFIEPTSDNEALEQIIEGEAVLHREPSEAAGVDKWVDRKSTRLNSSHVEISYAVFCLKKKKNRA